MEGSSSSHAEPECPLALLAQTCSKIEKKVLSPDCRQSNAFQLQSSTRGSLVKIAPAPDGSMLNDKTIPRVMLSSQKMPVHSLSATEGSSKYVYKVNLKHPITAAGNPNTFVFRTDMNCNNNSVINIPPTQQHAVLTNLVPLHIPCTGAGHVSDENILKFSNDSNPTQSNELVIGGEYLPVQGNGVMQLAPGTMLLTSCLPNSNNTAAATSVNLMQPQNLTAQMLEAISPKENEISSPATNASVSLKPKISMMSSAQEQREVRLVTTLQKHSANTQAARDQTTKTPKIIRPNNPCNATVQLTVPPNMTASGLKQFLKIAAQVAQKYQTTKSSGTLVIHGELNTKNSVLMNLKTATSLSKKANPVAISKMADKAVKKTRKPCKCPNCLQLGGSNRCATDHSKKRVHTCYYINCDREFSKTSHLRAHMRSHTGERPYACDIEFCGRRFTRSDELLRHRRTHGGFKKFNCHVCNKRFMRSDHLNKHIKIHSRNQAKTVSAEQSTTPQQTLPLAS